VAKVWASIPVKQFRFAKRRLAALMSDTDRAQLAAVMFADVLRALATSRHVDDVVVVTKEPEAVAIAERFGATCIDEEGDDLSGAVAQAARYLSANGVKTMLMLPGDVPLVTGAEIDRFVATRARAPSMSIIADLGQDGTNGLLLSPPDLMEFHFGPGSFAAHKAAAERVGAGIHEIRLSGFSLDIDNDEDLRRLMTYEIESSTLDFLCDSGVASRIPPRHNDEQLKASS
jgi:2-phospho-L-lactate guanylyltransferase